MSSQKKVNWHVLQGCVYSGEGHQLLLVTCCKYPTPLFDVSWPWGRLRRFGGFTTRRVLGPQ